MNLRIFNDENNQMNLSVTDVEGDLMIVPITLYASTKKGNRPSFINLLVENLQKNIFRFIDMLNRIYKFKVNW